MTSTPTDPQAQVPPLADDSSATADRVPQAFERELEAASESERIYEPKYGGKDHSGYETMMKYEINYERMAAFENGARWTLTCSVVRAMAEALEGYAQAQGTPNSPAEMVLAKYRESVKEGG